MVFRTHRESAISHWFQYPAELHRIYRDAKLVMYLTDQVYQPPAYNAVYGKNGAGFNHLGHALRC
jgi:hypothetical protein